MSEKLQDNLDKSGEQISGWEELSNLDDSSFEINQDTSEKATPETVNDNTDKIEAIATKIKATYEQTEAEEINDDDMKTNQETGSTKPSEIQQSKSETIASRYEAQERARVDQLKSELNIFNIHKFEKQAIKTEPSTFRKAMRLLFDKLGIKTQRSTKRREHEAMHIALTEYQTEKKAQEQAWQDEQERRMQAEAEREAKYEAELAQRERESLTRDMANAREALDYRRQQRFENQRAQEIIEQDLNSRLLTIDDLETAVLEENPEIEKRSVNFEGEEILVYDLKGLPFSMLSTTIDYRKSNDPGDIGVKTCRAVMENPAIWAERRDQAEQTNGFGTREEDARGDTISTSYRNSEHNFDSRVLGDLMYGFAGVEADSVLSIHRGDGGTSNIAGSNETELSKHMLDAISHLEGADSELGYNEILLRRYLENGVAKRPDYIITEDGNITEAALKHAKFFNIPIVNIESSIYREKAEKKGAEILNSITEDDNYLEMDQKIAQLTSLSNYKPIYRELERIGRNFDRPREFASATPVEQKCLEISRMEQLKRLDFVANVLEQETEKIKSATEKGELFTQKFEEFQFFNLSVQDVHHSLWSTELGDQSDHSYDAPGNCNFINIDFRLKDSSRTVKTQVYDGKRVLRADEALQYGNINQEDLENADSSFYNKLEPIIKAYFEAYRQNTEIAKAADHLKNASV